MTISQAFAGAQQDACYCNVEDVDQHPSLSRYRFRSFAVEGFVAEGMPV